ncbi:helix-turn-helix transcriptional regulator [Nannocystis radixulma]|uniref:AraC family transcriptional regulator n=1 Tax=Nannocystis radixulma TaxID=2995305 RepID=A0ABT5B152_9BACT|nr:AraC family transcriptional regulator [Nannocystis radixulma]MDC0667811.1 AraC family transcriptional regulator [Nannocystis radixulma]
MSDERASADDGAESAIRLVDRKTGREYATAAASAVLHASARIPWRSPLVLELHRIPPYEHQEHVVVGHQLMVNLGGPVRFGWQEDDRRREAMFATGALCIQSEGDANAPFWRDEMTFATASIPPTMVEALLSDRAPSPAATFIKRHCVADRSAEASVRSLVAELSSPTEPLRAEMLCHAFVLHLLGVHGQAPRRKQLAPRGKLGPAQLRGAVELAHERLACDLTLEAMAKVAGYSPFHFARLFKATTGLAPHQFVLQLRLERAARLLRGRDPKLGDIALATGFYDQAHFTTVFRKAFGVTPAAFAARTR